MAAEIAMAVGLPILKQVANSMTSAIFSSFASKPDAKGDDYVTPNAQIPVNLECHVIKIENVHVPHWHGKLDPYVAVYLSGKKKERTQTRPKHFGGKNSKIDQTLSLQYLGEPRLIVQLFDNGTLGVAEVFIAEVPMDLLPILNNPSRKWTGPVVIKNQKDKNISDKGRVFITVSFSGGTPYHPMNPTLRRRDADRVPRGPPPPPLPPSFFGMGGAPAMAPNPMMMMNGTMPMMSNPNMPNAMQMAQQSMAMMGMSPQQRMAMSQQLAMMASQQQGMMGGPQQQGMMGGPQQQGMMGGPPMMMGGSSQTPQQVMMAMSQGYSPNEYSSLSLTGAPPYTSAPHAGKHGSGMSRVGHSSAPAANAHSSSHPPPQMYQSAAPQGHSRVASGGYGCPPKSGSHGRVPSGGGSKMNAGNPYAANSPYEYPFNFSQAFAPEVGAELAKLTEDQMIESVYFT